MQAIPLVLGAAGAGILGSTAAVGVALGIGPIGATILGVSLSIAGALASVLLAPQQAKPKFEDGSQTFRQPIPPRVRGYGRHRLGGSLIFYDTNDTGDLVTLVCHVAHQIDGVEQHWLNDRTVEIDDDGEVTNGHYQTGREDSAVRIKIWPGAPGQAIANIGSDDWIAGAHRGEGLYVTNVNYSDLGEEEHPKVFENGAPAYRAVARLAKIFDPRDPTQSQGDETTYRWSDNAAVVLLDYLTRTEFGIPVGFGLPPDRVDPDSFAAAADVCDEPVALKAGGTEPRWRSWGAYQLDEQKKTVLSDLLDGCGGRLIQGPDGRIGLSVGAPGPVAAVTIGDDQILEYDFSTGTAAIERINEVRATYISQLQDWAEVEAGIQLDQASIDRNGIESSAIKLRFVPSESQAQRVAKSVLRRGNPEWSGKLRGTLALLDAWGERWVRLRLGELDIDTLFEITGMRLDRAGMTVEIDVVSYDGWWEWDAAIDEQDPPPQPDLGEPEDAPPPPTGVAVAIENRQVNGSTTVAVGVISWDEPSRDSFIGHARYRVVTVDGSAVWQILDAGPDERSVETAPLQDHTGYEAQARFSGSRGVVSAWAPATPIRFISVADPVAPGVPTGLTAMVTSGSEIAVSATAPNSPNHASLRLFRNSANSFAGAALIAGPLFGAAGAAKTHVDAPGVGDWWYFATAANGSDVQSPPAGGVLAELAPAAPAIASPSGPISSYDRRPPVSGSGQAGAAIRLFAGGVQVGTGTANGSGIWTVTPSMDLGIGANAMTATATLAGNESNPSGFVTITVEAIDADAWAWIVAMTVRPPFARQTLIETLVESLKAGGVWAKLDALYLLAAHDAQAARLNGRAPATFALTATASPVFGADRGYKGTGQGATAGGYLASSFNPSTSGGQWALDSAQISVWVRTAATSTTALQSAEIGASAGIIFTKHATAGTITTSLNDGTSSSTAAGTPNGIGLFTLSRTASTGYGKYHEGVARTAAAVASTALPASALAILRGGSASHSDAEISAACWGGGLTATEASALYDALHAYLQGVGAVT